MEDIKKEVDPRNLFNKEPDDATLRNNMQTVSEFVESIAKSINNISPISAPQIVDPSHLFSNISYIFTVYNKAIESITTNMRNYIQMIDDYSYAIFAMDLGLTDISSMIQENGEVSLPNISGLKYLDRPVEELFHPDFLDLLDETIRDRGTATGEIKSQKEIAVLKGTTLVNAFAAMGYVLPYQWNGGDDASHLVRGLDYNLGAGISAQDNNGYDTIRSFDCKGLVNYLFANATATEGGSVGSKTYNPNNPRYIKDAEPGDIIISPNPNYHERLVVAKGTRVNPDTGKEEHFVICLESHVPEKKAGVSNENPDHNNRGIIEYTVLTENENNGYVCDGNALINSIYKANSTDSKAN